MILEMTTSVLLSAANISTRGTSDAAQYVARKVEEGRQHLQRSLSLGLRGTGVFNQLFNVAQECSSEGWDGYGAAPVLDETYRQAYRFLEALPLGTPPPSVGVEADGHLTLEWYRSSRWVLSVSVSPDGMIYYAALLGSSKRSGTEPFSGDVPPEITQIIRRLSLA
jgi:hypothetical protein